MLSNKGDMFCDLFCMGEGWGMRLTCLSWGVVVGGGWAPVSLHSNVTAI